jgi:hypothetical protein
MLHLPIERYVNVANLQCLGIIAIRKIASLEHNSLEMDVHILSHGDTAPIIKIHYCLDDVNQDKVAHTPVQQYRLDYYRYQGTRACNSICHVCTL